MKVLSLSQFLNKFFNKFESCNSFVGNDLLLMLMLFLLLLMLMLFLLFFCCWYVNGQQGPEFKEKEELVLHNTLDWTIHKNTFLCHQFLSWKTLKPFGKWRTLFDYSSKNILLSFKPLFLQFYLFQKKNFFY